MTIAVMQLARHENRHGQARTVEARLRVLLVRAIPVARLLRRRQRPVVLDTCPPALYNVVMPVCQTSTEERIGRNVCRSWTWRNASEARGRG